MEELLTFDSPSKVKPSERLKSMKPKSLNRKEFEKVLNAHDKSPETILETTSGFNLKKVKLTEAISGDLRKRKFADVKSATHKFQPSKFTELTSLENDTKIEDEHTSNQGSALQCGSGLPKVDAKKMNMQIENSNKKSAKKSKLPFVQSPVSVTNKREKQYRQNLEGTYGVNYIHEQSHKTIDCDNSKYSKRRQRNKEVKEMNEYIKDACFSKTSSIPNSYLFQSESGLRSWLAKRGKLTTDYTASTIKRMRQFFHSLDTTNSGFVDLEQIEEVLITLGLCKTPADVQDQISILNKDVDGKLDFDAFLQLLKQTSALGTNSAKPPNFLFDKNLLGEIVPVKESLKLPQLQTSNESGISAAQFFENLRSHNSSVRSPKIISGRRSDAPSQMLDQIKSFATRRQSRVESTTSLVSKFDEQSHRSGKTDASTGTRKLSNCTGKYRGAKENIAAFF